MIIKPPKPGLGFGFWDFGFWDLVWLGLGVAKMSSVIYIYSLNMKGRKKHLKNTKITFSVRF